MIESTEFQNWIKGMVVECPFCDHDEVEYPPYPFLSSGACHECGREFDVVVQWEEE